MKLAGVIAEYNPFHSGHAYQLEAARAAGATHIAVTMSGSFVQRGGPSIFSKFARARAAVACGVDLVVELPTPYASSSARTFGGAGVYLLSQLGADMLSFGCEDEAKSLRVLAAQLFRAEESGEFQHFLAEGKSYPRARAEAAALLFGPEAALAAAKPNNLLAVEYLRAVCEYAPDMEIHAVPRLHTAHDSNEAKLGIASASHLRRLLAANGVEAIREFVPEPAFAIYREEIEAGRAPVTEAALERLVLCSLRAFSKGDFEHLPDVTEGMENRLYRAAQSVPTLQAFCETVKTKRFTMSRIRRIAWNSLLGISAEDIRQPPAYLRVLALNARGTEILSRAKLSTVLPIGVNFADLSRLKPRGLSADIRATDLHALGMSVVQPCGQDFTRKMTLQEK